MKSKKSKKKSFVCFLGESTACQSAYGFNWPLRILCLQHCNYNATSEIILTHYPQSGDWKDLGIYILSPVGRLYSSDNSF